MVRRMTSIIVILCVIMSFTTVAYADNIFSKPYDSSKYLEYLEASCTVNSDGSITLSKDISNILNTYRASSGQGEEVTIHGLTAYVTSDGIDKLRELSRNIYDDSTIENKMKDIGTMFNIPADVERATTMFSGAGDILGLILGIGVTAAVYISSFITLIDVLYLSIPTLNNKLDEIRDTGNNSRLVGQSKQGTTKLRLISLEAQRAVKQANLEGGRHPFTIYIGQRIVGLILFAITIAILMTGNITIMINISMKVVSGVFRVLSGLGS